MNGEEFVNANLAFLLESGDGTTELEREAEIMRTAFQTAGGTPYDRDNGGSFEEIEQDPGGAEGGVNIADVMFAKRMMESIYRLNAERSWSPGIVVWMGEPDGKETFNSSDNSQTFFIEHMAMEDLASGSALVAL